MEQEAFIQTVKHKKQTIISIMILCLLVTTIFTLIQPLKYGTESRILILQNNITTFDPYAMSKSSEYLSSLLSRVLTSSLFFDDVMAANFNIDKSYFPSDSEGRLKTWQKTISSKTLNDSGIIVITISHENRYQSLQIAQAVNDVLVNKHGDFDGAGSQVTLKIIDVPITSSFPDQPNFALNFSLGIVIGLGLAFSYVYFFPEENYDIRLWPRGRRKASRKQYVQPRHDVLPPEKGVEIVDEFEPRIDNLFR